MCPQIFTLRERQILSLIGLAKSSKIIAYELGLSIHTVSTHRKHLCHKLGIHSAVELFSAAMRISTACSQRCSPAQYCAWQDGSPIASWRATLLMALSGMPRGSSRNVLRKKAGRAVWPPPEAQFRAGTISPPSAG